MTCDSCGAWAPRDQETGYDADDVCPGCAADSEDGWDAQDYYEHCAQDEQFEAWREQEVFGE